MQFKHTYVRSLIFALTAILGATMLLSNSACAADAPPFAAALRPLLLAKLQAMETPGAIVLVDVPGQGTWIEALGTNNLAEKTPMSPTDHMRIGSITKTLTGVAILLLVDDGKIALDDPVSKYRQDISDGDHISIKQLMNMTSGLFNSTEDDALNVAIDAEPFKIWNPDQVISLAVAHKPYFEPGKGFHYSNTNYDILGQIAQQISGTSLSDVFAERIFAPLGMTESSLPKLADLSIAEPYSHGYMYATNVAGNQAYIALVTGASKDPVIASPTGTPPADATHRSNSYSWASGAAISTAHDMQLWAKALATGVLLKPETRKLQVTWSPHAHYGLGITESIKTMLGHNGAVPGYQSVIGYDVGSGATIVVLANLTFTPNVPLQNSFPADEMADLIYTTLFH